MNDKLAVVIIHGAGIHHQSQEDKDSMVGMQERLVAAFEARTGNNALEFELIYWDDGSRLQNRQDKLRQTLEDSGVHFGGFLDLTGLLREYIFDRFGDVVAYQPVNDPRLKEDSTYSIVHKTVAESLARLSERAGKNAPLCIIAHSLGSVIASNYFYDLQNRAVNPNLIPPPVEEEMKVNLLEQGETLCCLFTMGSPMALWRLRTGQLNKPITVPVWVNFFDDNDVVAFPLEKVFEQDNGEKLVEDCRVETGISPLSHSRYWQNDTVINVIVNHLVEVWNS